MLVDKLVCKIKMWQSRNLSYAARTLLINSVLLGLISFWASVFILPQGVMKIVEQICRNFLWSATEDYRRRPLVAWGTNCFSKSCGGLGIKDFELWNKVLIAKHLWALFLKKDNLWVRWIHSQYLANCNIWEYQQDPDTCWYWKKLCRLRIQFRELICEGKAHVCKEEKYNAGAVYKWITRNAPKVSWNKYVWSRGIIPKHSFNLWLLIQNRLPTRARLACHLPNIEDKCGICAQPGETIEHIFYDCSHAKEVRIFVLSQFKVTSFPSSLLVWHWWLLKYKKGKVRKYILMCASAAIHYQI